MGRRKILSSGFAVLGSGGAGEALIGARSIEAKTGMFPILLLAAPRRSASNSTGPS